MQRSLAKRIGYQASQMLARFVGTFLYRVRVFGREHVPPTGGGLVCANHQSYFDPIILGLAVDRRMNYLARDTLFRNPAFKRVLEYFDSIPIEREGRGLAGLKETLRRLKQDELVLIFPEGTRTRDGCLLPMKSGFCSVARRSRQPIIPIGFDGAYQAWPRTSSWPQLSVITVVIGKPIFIDEVEKLTDLELVAELTSRIRACFEQAQRISGTASTRDTGCNHVSFPR